MNTNCNWDSVKKQVPEWFRDAKFGLFFHWGPYCVPAYENEWYSRNMYGKGLSQNRHHEKTYGALKDFGYKDFFPMFTGEKFNADEWADLVVRSGAKYAGPVTEHADNFSMWDSKINSVNSVNYGPQRDITGECAKAFREKDIKVLATFHHQWLWGWFMSSDNEADVYDPKNTKYYWDALPLETNRYHPYRMPDQKFNQMWLEKVKEVVEKYDPDALYFDSRTFIIDEAYRLEMVRHFHEAYPERETVITYKQEDFPNGIGVYDIECGRFSQCKDFPWQTDDRLEDNITWCIVKDPKYKSPTEIIHHLCDVVSKNGNLLLNVGPAADGSFHNDAKKVLYQVGDWLEINGEAIYGTRPYTTSAEGPTTVKDENYDVDKINEQLEDGLAVDMRAQAFTHQDFRFTKKGDAVYAIALGWPEDNQLEIRSLGEHTAKRKIATVSLLGSNGTLNFTQTEQALSFSLPEKRPCEHAYCLKIRFM